MVRLSTQIRSNNGTKETKVTAFDVIPRTSPQSAMMIIVTPVGKQPMSRRNSSFVNAICLPFLRDVHPRLPPTENSLRCSAAVPQIARDQMFHTGIHHITISFVRRRACWERGSPSKSSRLRFTEMFECPECKGPSECRVFPGPGGSPAAARLPQHAPGQRT